MSLGVAEAELRFSKGLIKLRDWYSIGIMDGRTRKISAAPHVEGKKIDYRRTLSHHGSSKRLLPMPASYFSLESLLILVCLTASLLILPLILPPLPPPPFMLLLLPIGILALLMILAFMPSNARDMTYKYM